jgi:hypothetical protein
MVPFRECCGRFTRKIPRWPRLRPADTPGDDHADRVTPLSGTQLRAQLAMLRCTWPDLLQQHGPVNTCDLHRIVMRVRNMLNSADPDVSAWRPQRTSPAELYGLAMQRSWRRGGDRLLWPAGSAPGSRSASAGVVLRRSELLRVAPFCWSGRIAAGQPKWLGFMACKRSGVRIPVAPQVRRIIRTDRTLSTAAEYSNAGRSAAARQFGYGLRAE